MRLQKYIANAGICSRRHAEELITADKVKVNGKIVNTLGSKVDLDQDKVMVNNKPISLSSKKLLYIALHKPIGYSSTLRRSRHERRIISDLLVADNSSDTNPPTLPRVFPAGRLDKDTSGLILLTNDGDFHLAMTHPSQKVSKEYEVSCRDRVSDEMLAILAQGIILDGKQTLPALTHRLSPKTFRLVISEGRNRQIRRMCQKIQNPVEKLHRVRIGKLKLGDLLEGKWKTISPSEVKKATAH